MIYNTLKLIFYIWNCYCEIEAPTDMIDLLIKGVVKDPIRTCVTKIKC